MTYPEDVTKAIGFKYEGGIVPDDNYLSFFVKDSMIIKKYTYYRLRIGFSDDDYTGVYKIEHEAAKYKIKFLSKDNYWLYKIE